MWPWDELGLDPTDDERLIRKAYAERARQHRPDDDPDRFIRLRAAYDAALATLAVPDKVVRLDGFRSRPTEAETPPKPEPRAAPPPRTEPVPEPPAREPVTPRNARIRIERVGQTGRTDEVVPPLPPAVPKSKVRIERVDVAPPPPSPPPPRPKIRIERVAPPANDPKVK